MSSPSQRQNELKQAFPQLRVVLPAAAAVVWVVKKFFFKRGDVDQEKREKKKLIQISDTIVENEGVPIDVELPRESGAVSNPPFQAPRSLTHTLLDITLKVSLSELWGHLMSGKSETLVEFHEITGDHEIVLGSWRQLPDGTRCRLLKFKTPLRNGWGSREAINKQIFTVEYIGTDAWVISSICNTEGVPFATKFANSLQWVATSVTPTTTRLRITGACRFVDGFWGPLKGTISRESIKGMNRSYSKLKKMLEEKYHLEDSSYLDASAKGEAGEESSILSLAQGAQIANPAIIVAFFAMIFIVWRMALMDTFILHVMQKIASGARTS